MKSIPIPTTHNTITETKKIINSSNKIEENEIVVVTYNLSCTNSSLPMPHLCRILEKYHPTFSESNTHPLNIYEESEQYRKNQKGITPPPGKVEFSTSFLFREMAENSVIVSPSGKINLIRKKKL